MRRWWPAHLRAARRGCSCMAKTRPRRWDRAGARRSWSGARPWRGSSPAGMPSRVASGVGAAGVKTGETEGNEREERKSQRGLTKFFLKFSIEI